MSKYLRLVFAGCVAVLAMSLLAGSAVALRSLSVNRTRVSATSRSVIFTGAELNTTCEVTLNGETTTTAVAKGSTSQIGVITEGRTTNCRGAARRAVILNTAVNPMRLAYTSFAGTLPRITSVTVTASNALFELQETFAGNCLYRGDAVRSVFSETLGGQRFNQAEFNRAASTLNSGGFFCPRTGTITGTFTLTPTLNVGLL